MPRQTWIIATILSALVVVGVIGFSAWQKSQEIDRLRDELREAREAARQVTQKGGSLQNELAALRERIMELQREHAAAAQQQSALEQQMRAALESKDITISELQGRLTVNIVDRILFDSGEADLRPEGQAVLLKVAGILAQHPKRQIHVIGHTDNVPIRKKFPSNWELSCARATAAVRFLQDQAAVDPRRLGALGYGEFHPLADNATAEGRAKNRRIAIVVLPEELAPTDVKPAPSASPP
jgi:chemotaxis protein MotB